MKVRRGGLKGLVAITMSLVLGALVNAHAQDAVDSKMSIVVPVPPGGPMDFAARLLASEFQKRWGRTAIVDNRPGAGALIGAEYVSRARPDGTTLLVHNTSIVAYPIFVNTKFDSSRDLKPISTLMGVPYVLFASSSMPKTLPEIIAYAKANSGKINIGVIPNTLQQLRTFKLLKAIGITAVSIPYAGTTPIQRALLANEVQLYMASPFGMDAFVKDGRLHAIATMAEEPYWKLPEVPTAKSQGINFETSEKYLLFAPADTPAAVVGRINREVQEILKDPQVVAQVKAIGNIAQSTTPEQTDKELRELTAEAVDLGKQAGVKRGQ